MEMDPLMAAEISTAVVSVTATMTALTSLILVRRRHRKSSRSGPYRTRIYPLLSEVRDRDGEALSLLGVPIGIVEVIPDTLSPVLASRAGLKVYDMICMFLFYLRHYPCLSVLSALSGNCGEASALTVIKDVLPQFLAHYGHYIKMEVRAGGFISNDTSIGSLDGTPLNIHRPGEDERRYYRGDKARHFVTALILCNREEQILWVGVGFPGHENDEGNYNVSNLRIFLEQQQLTVIADGGFYGPQMDLLFLPIQLLKRHGMLSFNMVAV